MATDRNLEDFILNNREEFDAEMPPPNLWDRIDSAITPKEEEPDNLEAFIAANRDAFDTATPPPKLTAAIFNDLQPAAAGATTAPPLQVAHSNRRPLWSLMGMAATVCILVVAAFLLGTNQGYQTAEADLVAAELEKIDPDFVEAERYYQNEIASHMTNIRQVSTDPQLVADLAEIDQATEEIRASLLEVPESQRPALVEEMIRIYRTKLDILMRVQRQITPTGPAPAGTLKKNNEL